MQNSYTACDHRNFDSVNQVVYTTLGGKPLSAFCITGTETNMQYKC